MYGEAHQGDPSKAQRVELILQEMDSLPTLGQVAIRLLELTADDEAQATEVIDLVKSDPALASRVLSLCRCHDRGRSSQVATVDRAVLLLGFEAVRCAVLSVKVFELIDGMGSPAGEDRSLEPVFDREAFWMHSLAVAVASEQIAVLGTLTRDVRPSEAFMAGLLHDLGQLVLHVLLPESFDQVCRIAETHTASLDRACRQIIGLDTHTPGKRLAEHWGLPPSLVDVIWLNGQPLEALPPVPHRTLISLVTLADAVVRGRYITPGAQWSRNEDLATLVVPVGISLEQLDAISDTIHEEVSQRATAIGMSETHAPNVLLRSIYRANESLARANAGMRQRERLARRQARMLTSIVDFHDKLPTGSSVVDTLSHIASSAAAAFQVPIMAALYGTLDRDADDWRYIRFGSSYRPYGGCRLVLPGGAVPFGSLVSDIRVTASAVSIVPWLGEYLGGDVDPRTLRVLPLTRDDTPGNALLVLDGSPEGITDRDEIEPLLLGWQASLTAGLQHDSGAHLTEQLAEANRSLHDVQEAMARNRTLSTLGEVAAGAAHEMNNPLTIISGRSQLLATRIQDPEQKAMAGEIATEAHRLSDMITALRSFAEPLEPDIRGLDLAKLVVRIVQAHAPKSGRQPKVNTIFTEPFAPVYTDAELLATALSELVKNAVESKGTQHIELRVQTDPLDGRLKIQVRDDGEGMSEHTLRHAFDPFFSSRPAGRQPGLGLARARRSVEAMGGRITLVNGAVGSVATIWLSDWRQSSEQPERDAA